MGTPSAAFLGVRSIPFISNTSAWPKALSKWEGWRNPVNWRLSGVTQDRDISQRLRVLSMAVELITSWWDSDFFWSHHTSWWRVELVWQIGLIEREAILSLSNPCISKLWQSWQDSAVIVCCLTSLGLSKKSQAHIACFTWPTTKTGCCRHFKAHVFGKKLHFTHFTRHFTHFTRRRVYRGISIMKWDAALSHSVDYPPVVSTLAERYHFWANQYLRSCRIILQDCEMCELLWLMHGSI